MKRIALVLGVAAAIGVLPSVASGAVQPAVFKPSIVKPAIVKPVVFKPSIVRPWVVKPAVFKPALVRPLPAGSVQLRIFVLRHLWS